MHTECAAYIMYKACINLICVGENKPYQAWTLKEILVVCTLYQLRPEGNDFAKSV